MDFNMVKHIVNEVDGDYSIKKVKCAKCDNEKKITGPYRAGQREMCRKCNVQMMPVENDYIHRNREQDPMGMPDNEVGGRR